MILLDLLYFWQKMLDWVHQRRYFLTPLFVMGMIIGVFLIQPARQTSANVRLEPEINETAMPDPDEFAAGGLAASATPILPTAVIVQPTSEPAQDNPGSEPPPRATIIKYTIEEGDSIFAIAEKFGLQPETILWGNLYILGDNIHNIMPGVEINILPRDGVLHRWINGEGLNGVSRYYGVDPMAIVTWPGNNFDLATIGDFSNPNIAEGIEFFVPGGKRETVSWIPPNLTRENAAVASSLGPGSCGSIFGGAIGGGTYIWPAPSTRISGWDFTPETGHSGIDIGGNEGDNLFAVDGGVVVYAGWHEHGYGNLVIIDHGNGFQSVYAHLNDIWTTCGADVAQSTVIGSLGNTGNSSGPHLHFELRYNGSPVSPWEYLP